MDEVAAIALGALIVAIIFNGYLVWYNGKVINEMRITRKAEFLPRIKLSIDYPTPTIAFLKIENIGKGPILQLDSTINIVPREPIDEKAIKQTRTFSQELMTSGEYESFFVTPANVKDMRILYEKAILTGSFKDIYGETHIINDEVPFGDILQDKQKPAQLFKKDHIEGIKKNLEEIGKQVENLNRTMDRVRADIQDAIKEKKGE